MQFDIYRKELPNLGETHIIFAWSGAIPRPDWGNKIDSLNAPTARDAAQIYFDRNHLQFPWGGLSAMSPGVSWVNLKHKEPRR
jgi:hypothetical protein